MGQPAEVSRRSPLGHCGLSTRSRADPGLAKPHENQVQALGLQLHFSSPARSRSVSARGSIVRGRSGCPRSAGKECRATTEFSPRSIRCCNLLKALSSGRRRAASFRSPRAAAAPRRCTRRSRCARAAVDQRGGDRDRVRALLTHREAEAAGGRRAGGLGLRRREQPSTLAGPRRPPASVRKTRCKRAQSWSLRCRGPAGPMTGGSSARGSSGGVRVRARWPRGSPGVHRTRRDGDAERLEQCAFSAVS